MSKDPEKYLEMSGNNGATAVEVVGLVFFDTIEEKRQYLYNNRKYIHDRYFPAGGDTPKDTVDKMVGNKGLVGPRREDAAETAYPDRHVLPVNSSDAPSFDMYEGETCLWVREEGGSAGYVDSFVCVGIVPIGIGITWPR